MSSIEFLKKYFERWEAYVQPELIGGFLSLLGDGKNGEIRSLVADYLHHPHDIDTVRLHFLNGADLSIQNFDVTQNSDDLEVVYSILRQEFSAPLNQKIESIVLEVKRVIDSGNHQKLTLRAFDAGAFSGSLDEILKQSTIDLILKAYRNPDWKQHVFLTQWQQLSTSSQTSIAIAHKLFLKYAPNFLIDLNVGLKHEGLKQILNKWENLESAQESKKLFVENLRRTTQGRYAIEAERESYERIKTKIKDTRKEIYQLLEMKEIKAAILEAIRNKIYNESYRLQSIPFELFQNADDAVLELEEMGEHGSEGKQFVIHIEKDKLTFLHWGRPINYYRNDPQYPDRDQFGFHRDLEKMLAFRSEKNYASIELGSEERTERTGQFGLGFKSVHLLTSEPRVLSGRLGFKIEGGRIPRELEQEHCDRLRAILNTYNDGYRYGLKGTLIELPFDNNAPLVIDFLKKHQSLTDIAKIFSDLAGILTVFAKRIRCCVVSGRTIQWQPAEIYSDIEVGDLDIKGQKEKAMCLRSSKDGVALLVLLDKETGCLKELPKGIPDIWVTAPTHEGMAADEEQSDREIVGLGFALNGKFDIGTGRTRLMSKSPKSEETARKIGEMVFEKLSQLFMDSNALAEIQRNLGMEIPIDRYSFWDSVWKILGKGWLNKRGRTEALHITRLALGGNNGIGKLILETGCIPNGLLGEYQELIAIKNINYQLSGVLASQPCLESVKHFNSLEDYRQRTVHKSVLADLQNILDDSHPHHLGHVKELRLTKILKKEFSSHLNISPEAPPKLASVLTSEFMDQLPSEDSCEIEGFLAELKFLSQDNSYSSVPNLLSSSKEDFIWKEERWATINGITRPPYNEAMRELSEERLLAAFAPTTHLLNNKYPSQSLTLFHKLSSRFKFQEFSKAKVAGWIEASILEQREGVRFYLVENENRGSHALSFKDEVIRILRGKYNTLPEWLKNILKNILDSLAQGSIDQPTNLTAALPVDLEALYDRWIRRKADIIAKYERATYPNGQFPQLSADEDALRSNINARSNWLILLFLGATHTIGRQSRDQHRGFIEHCQREGWWDVFATPNPQDQASAWMRVIDQYLVSNDSNMTYFHWMRYFVTLYQLALYMEEYGIRILSAMNQQNNELPSLEYYLNPNDSHLFSGASFPHVPPLTKTLGIIGANFVIRELVRKEFIKHNAKQYFVPYCFVPTGSVREQFHLLDPSKFTCIDRDKANPNISKRIYKFLTEQHPIDPTFLDSFDLPFLYINELM